MRGLESCLCQRLECQTADDDLGKPEKNLVNEEDSRDTVTMFRLNNSLY